MERRYVSPKFEPKFIIVARLAEAQVLFRTNSFISNMGRITDVSLLTKKIIMMMPAASKTGPAPDERSSDSPYMTRIINPI